MATCGSLPVSTRRKYWESQLHRQVNVSFADPVKSKFLSASGSATLIRDREKMKELWSPVHKIFFSGRHRRSRTGAS